MVVVRELEVEPTTPTGNSKRLKKSGYVRWSCMTINAYAIDGLPCSFPSPVLLTSR